MKIRAVEKTEGSPDFIFFCPACQCGHGIWTTARGGNNALWSFDGNMEKPTINPSILLRHTKYEKGEDKMPIPETVKDIVCHSVVTDGMIYFCGDCTHDMKGKKVELPDF